MHPTKLHYSQHPFNSEPLLFDALVAGHSKAWDFLYRDSLPIFSYQVYVYYGFGLEAAKDWLQDAMIDLVNNFRQGTFQLKVDSKTGRTIKVATYLIHIAHQKAKMHIRKHHTKNGEKKVSFTSYEDWQRKEKDTDFIDEGAFNQILARCQDKQITDLREVLEKAINLIENDKLERILTGFYFEDKTMHELEKETGYSNARVQRIRAVEALQRKFKKQLLPYYESYLMAA